MNDTELYGRLVDLGMPQQQAWPLTARIRDVLHPVAAVAAAKIHKAMRAPGMGGLGLAESTGSKALTVTAISAGSSVAAGAIAGSVVPGIGTAVGAIAGLLASKLIHTSQGPQRAALSSQIVNALNQIPSSFVGRTIPWSAGPPNLGLFQMIQAVMTLQIWLGWNSGLQSPTINGNWATVWTNIVKQIVAAIVANPVGATVSLTLTNHPGGADANVTPFSFTNPGLSVGPDVLANTLMAQAVSHQMIQGGRADMAQNAVTVGWPTAAKVFALMFDHAAADAVPNSLSTTLANAPIVNVPPAIAQAAAPIAAAAVQNNQIPALTTNGDPPGYQSINPTGYNGAPLYVAQADAGKGNQNIPTYAIVNGTMTQVGTMYNAEAQAQTLPANPVMANVSTPSNVNSVYEANPTTGVPSTLSVTSQLPAQVALTPQQDSTAGLMQNMLASSGANFTSPDATQLLADVAANGVEATPAGPPITGSIPIWAIAGGAALVLILLLKR
jgi:hypothetical protein